MTAVRLPIDAHLAALQDAVRQHASVIIKAEPGTGKTTRVPPALLDVLPGKILVLEPRRLAARLSAQRIAQERGQTLGDEVGYRVRFDARESARTRLSFLTEGLFLRILYDNPSLDGVSAVILDEFHERNIQTDLAIALCRKLQLTSRPDLKLIVMSATLDTASLETYLDQCRSFDIKGRTFPVQVHYAPPLPQDSLEKSVLFAVDRLVVESACTGDVLVFLTGRRDIDRVAGYLESQLPAATYDVLPLTAELPESLQARVFNPSPRRKIILATNVAETSVTLPNVTAVIDSGLAKIASHAPWSGMPTLEVKRISQASAEQRAGRAGRTAPGVVLRLYSEQDFLGRPRYTPPDIERLDLTPYLLDILVWHHRISDDDTGSTTDFINLLPWFEKPNAATTASAMRVLQYLGAIDAHGALTDLAPELSRLPIHPRLARMILEGMATNYAPHALLGAVILREDFIWEPGRPPHTHGGPCDLGLQIDAMIQKISGRGHGNKAGIDERKVPRIRQMIQSLSQRLGIPHTIPSEPADHSRLAPCLLAGFPDRVAKRRKAANRHHDGAGHYHLCLGRGGMLDRSSVVRQSEYIVVLDGQESLQKDGAQSILIRYASQMEPAWLMRPALPLFQEVPQDEFQSHLGKYQSFIIRTYGQLEIERSLVAATPSPQQGQLSQILKDRWPFPFEDAGDLVRYHVKAALIRSLGFDESLPEFSGEMLELLQECICEGKKTLRDITSRPLTEYIQDQLTWEQNNLLRSLTPDSIQLQGSRRLHIHYEADKGPWIEGYIQDFFGQTATPAILGGRQPLVIHFLGPNKKPLQVTADLPGFWVRSYPAVKKELERRYPRHFWPENPGTAASMLHKPRNLPRTKI